MSDRDSKPTDNRTPGHPAGLPPEAHNDEQDQQGEQAQDVADDARRAASHTASPLESTKPEAGGFDPAPASKGDLVDEMRRMEGEGRIDMSAYAGEPNHDDEPETYGTETTDDDDTDTQASLFTADGENLTEAEAAELRGDEDLLDDEEE